MRKRRRWPGCSAGGAEARARAEAERLKTVAEVRQEEAVTQNIRCRRPMRRRDHLNANFGRWRLPGTQHGGIRYRCGGYAGNGRLFRPVPNTLAG